MTSNSTPTPSWLLCLALLLAGCDDDAGSVIITDSGCWGRNKPRVTITQEVGPDSVKCTIELQRGK